MTDWDGKDRRSDDARLAVVESRVDALKESQASIHKRISALQQEVKADMSAGFESVRNAITAVGAEARARDEKHAEKINIRLTHLESWRNWLTGAYVATAAIVSGWIGFGGHKK